MTTYEQLVMLADSLTVAEKVSFLEHLSSSLKRDLQTEAYKQMPWEQCINLTYGSLSDDPIERPPQPEANAQNNRGLNRMLSSHVSLVCHLMI